MAQDYSYVKCPQCGYDRNSMNAAKCEICGYKLKKGLPLVPILATVAGIAVFGGGGYWLITQITRQDSPSAVAPPSPSPTAPPVAPTSPAATTQTPVTPVAPASTTPGITVVSTLAQVPNVPSGNFNYGGSTTFAPLRSQRINDAINQAHPNFRLRYVEPPGGKPGSGAGIEMLLNGQLAITQSSRPLKDNEFQRAQTRGFRLEQVPIANDALAIYVHPGVQLPGLTVAQVRDIFTGKVTNWQQVGGPNLPIVPFSRNLQAGGTVDFFKEDVLQGQNLGANVRETRDTTDSLRKVGATPGGVGYANVPLVVRQEMVRIVPVAREAGSPYVAPDIAGREVNATVITDGSYPITRRLFIIIKRDGSSDEQASVAYANLFLSDEGQKLIKEAGFAALR
ncbi:ABC-type phosphate transport system, periplasmic component [Gloeomargarita lithophora Alchichica-D10]|uniref:ABC-type phosphate transport system, periplasmic component n=1 Tax=Gloeomargarita lithophora Alchichica-D10 TaxID=1188229 RepID=A0A1J0AAF3_9CYAN|nr:PstS family phosphate ABC transporter substrate-binding protein [Gloeomargarita lithophora]APB32910.1 ABC-type phosphate transport system, periplasmic component [Gloeomargarita lithophora Alchichica-D10]